LTHPTKDAHAHARGWRISEPGARFGRMSRFFSRERPTMRLTPHGYSLSVLRKFVRSAAREPSVREASPTWPM
ncbi:hypothetical protein, partial [Aquisphaera insulae]|uniref:hypothetical protein n=1 Tax=Aquisphaera insulae TaxID=2712864 RepID=UPI00196AE862